MIVFITSLFFCASGHSCTTAKAKAYSITKASRHDSITFAKWTNHSWFLSDLFSACIKTSNRINATTWDEFESQAVWLPDVPAFQQETTVKQHLFRKRLTIKTENMNTGSVAKWPVSAPDPANTWRTTLPDRKLEKSWLVPGDPRGNPQSVRTKRFDLCVFEIKQLSLCCQILGWSCKRTYLSSLSFLMKLFSLAFSASPWAKKQDG